MSFSEVKDTEIKGDKDLEDYRELVFQFDSLMKKIKDTVPEEHAALKVLVFQNIEVGYFWLRKIYEIMEIVKRPPSSKENQHGSGSRIITN